MLDDAQQQMVIEYHSLARAAAWKFFQRAPGASLDELHGVAQLALVEACERWPRYCAEHQYDPSRRDFLTAYLNRRCHGAVLDWARNSDHLTRSDRTIHKALMDAADSGLDQAEAAAEAGVSGEKAREVLARHAARPVSLDGQQGGIEDDGGSALGGYGSTLADETVDVESSAVVSQVLGAATDALRELGGLSRVAVVLRFYSGLSLPDIAECLGLADEPGLVGKLLEKAILDVHGAMLKAAAAG